MEKSAREIQNQVKLSTQIATVQLQKEMKKPANRQLKATVSAADKLKRLRDVSLQDKQFRNSTSSKGEKNKPEKVCIACDNPNSDICSCFSKPEKKREIDAKLEELFSAQKLKMSVSEYRQYEHHRKCYMQKQKVPYSEMIMGHGDDDMSEPDVFNAYYANWKGIQELLGTMGIDIGLPSLTPDDNKREMVIKMFFNHQMLAEALRGKRSPESRPNLIGNTFGGVSFQQPIAGYLRGKGFDSIWESIQEAAKGETTPTLSDYTRILAQPELFGTLQEWLNSCKEASPEIVLEHINTPTEMSMDFQDGRQVITIPDFENETETAKIFRHFLDKLAKPYYDKVKREIDDQEVRKFGAMLFHSGKISFRNAEGSKYDHAKRIADDYLNFSWTQ